MTAATLTSTSLLDRIPLLGWSLRGLRQGPDESKLLFGINCFLIWIFAIAYFGYPAFIIPVLCAVPVMFFLIIMITLGK